MQGSKAASQLQTTFAAATAQHTERIVGVETQIDDTSLRDSDDRTASLYGIVNVMGEILVIAE